jgi:malate dehydrogenase
MFVRSAIARSFSAVGSRGYKVCVVGASGGIGQPLSLLMKLDTRVTELSLYDGKHR